MDIIRSLDTDDMARALQALAPEDRAGILSVGASFHRLTVKKRLERAERKVGGLRKNITGPCTKSKPTGYPIMPTMPLMRIMWSGTIGSEYWSGIKER